MQNIQNIKNLFYRNRYVLLLRFLYVMIFLNLALVIALLYFITHIPLATTFSSYEKKTTRIYAFQQPIVSQKALLEWVNQAAVSIYNLDYLNYQKELKEASSFFTPSGWQLFQNDFQPVINAVTTKKLRVSSVVTGAPVITEEGSLLGRYSWKISMPLLVTYESASETRAQPLFVRMVVMRVPTSVSNKGVAIGQLYVTERGGHL